MCTNIKSHSFLYVISYEIQNNRYIRPHPIQIVKINFQLVSVYPLSKILVHNCISLECIRPGRNDEWLLLLLYRAACAVKVHPKLWGFKLKCKYARLTVQKLLL